MNKIRIIGIGYKPLDKRAWESLLNSSVILASKRLVDVFGRYEEYNNVKDRIKVINSVDETITFIKSLISNPQPPNIILLASGDPLFFGIGRRMIKEFGKDVVEIFPDLSSVQLAFSRIMETWDDALLISLHGGPDPEKRRRLPYAINDIPALLQRHNKIAILTDKENNPTEIAKVILSTLNLPTGQAGSQLSTLTMYVCERLGYPDEKIIEGTPEDIAAMEFSEPNIVILIKESPLSSFPPVGNPSEPSESPKKDSGQAGMTDEIKFGLSENEITHSKGLITKDEIRAVTIHKLRLPQRGIFWDIGAGSGSVSLEAAKLHPELKVFAVEKDEEQIENLKKNKIKFDANNVEIIEGEAPDALINIPRPDRVFIGGSSGRFSEIIDFISRTEAASIVINAATIETLNAAIGNLENKGFEIEISEVSVSRSKIIAGRRHMQALNPIFIITGQRRA